jgi:hypothetical protein
MPRIVTETPEHYESITRPVALDVVRHLIKTMNLPSDIKILYPGSSEEAPMPGSLISENQPQNFFQYDGRVRIEVIEDYTEDHSWSRTVLQKDTLPIFLDPLLKVRLAPVYVPCELTFDFTYRAPNRVMAEKFREEARIKSAMLREDQLLEVTYHYALPPYFVELLKEIHKLRENVAPYREDIFKWLGDNFSDRATTLTTLIGTEPTLVIPETQVCVIGYFDFSQNPERAEKDSEAGPFNLRFQYKVQYDKVTGVSAEYPLVIHNQLINETFRYTPNVHGEQVDPARRIRRPSASRHAMDHFVTVYPKPCYRGMDGISIPVFDDWSPEQVRPDTSTLLSIMLTIDHTQPTLLLDLDELGEWTIDPDISAFMVTEGAHMTRYMDSVIHISLFEDELPIQDNQITVNLGLTLHTKTPMQLRKRYHLRVALVNDLTSLNAEAIRRLSESGRAGLKILMTLQHRSFETARLPRLAGGRVIPRTFIQEVGVAINDLKQPHSEGFEYRMLTVGNFLIQTNRIDDHANRAEPTNRPNHNTNTDSASPVGPDQTDGYVYPVPGCNG